MKRSILLKDTHFHDFPFILPVIIFISRINTAFPLLPRNKKAAPHGAAVVNFMNTNFSAIS